jgi:hypothetical protein
VQALGLRREEVLACANVCMQVRVCMHTYGPATKLASQVAEHITRASLSPSLSLYIYINMYIYIYIHMYVYICIYIYMAECGELALIRS